MRKLLVLPVALLLLSFDKSTLLDQPMPLLPGNNKTLDGKTIDGQYFKGHVTVVSFMFIGCQPCMIEISSLNQLHDDYLSDPRLQVLCVARQMRSQMTEFNSNGKPLLAMVRRAVGADSIRYAILPACPEAESKMVKDEKVNGNDTDEHITVKSECSLIEERYGFTAFPTTFFIDKKGVIRKISTGAPQTKNNPQFYAELKQEVDALLAE